MQKRDWEKWVWRVGPIGVIVGIGIFTDWLALGIRGVKWLDYLWLSVGWIAGWVTVDADKYLAGVKGMEKWMAEWSRAVRNALTAVILAILGLWLASSSNSLFASSLVFGMSVRLFSEFVYTKDYRGWYWIIAREISEREHRIFKIIWGALLVLNWLFLVRG